MTHSSEHQIAPLTKELLPKVPCFIRWSGSLNNRWNESAVESVLAIRSRSGVVAHWAQAGHDPDLVERILAAIGKEIGWKEPRFIPDDEVFVVMKLWWHGVADCWERERCIWAIEAIYAKKLAPSVLDKFMDIRLGDFLTYFRDTPKK